MRYIDMQGTQLPALGFGTWQLTGDTCQSAVQKALEIGYRHIDTAQVYGNEAEVGNAIAQTGVPRDQLFLTTKIWTHERPDFKLLPVKESFEQSLQKLQTDYVDLLLVHWPNEKVPFADTLGAMRALQNEGKVRHIGVSNFPVALMKQAVEELGFDIACNQVEYHVLLSQKPVLDYARQHNIAVTAYSPLARGNLGENTQLMGIAKKHGKTVGQIALRWLIEQPGVAAIPKASSEKHMRENFDIFDFALDAEDKALIEQMDKTQRLTNPDIAPQWDKAA